MLMNISIWPAVVRILAVTRRTSSRSALPRDRCDVSDIYVAGFPMKSIEEKCCNHFHGNDMLDSGTLHDFDLAIILGERK